jgi:hypothetical protein
MSYLKKYELLTSQCATLDSQLNAIIAEYLAEAKPTFQEAEDNVLEFHNYPTYSQDTEDEHWLDSYNYDTCMFCYIYDHDHLTYKVEEIGVERKFDILRELVQENWFTYTL